MNNKSKYLMIFASLTFAVWNIKCTQQHKSNEAHTIATIDNEIGTLRYRIDSIRTNVSRQIQDSLSMCGQYIYIRENREKVEQLAEENKEILKKVYNLVKRQSPFNIPKCNETLFTENADMGYLPRNEVDYINYARQIYFSNKRKITKFNKAEAALKKIEPSIRNHFGQHAIAQISDMQLQIDSLLNKKIAVLNGGAAKQK